MNKQILIAFGLVTFFTTLSPEALIFQDYLPVLLRPAQVRVRLNEYDQPRDVVINAEHITEGLLTDRTITHVKVVRSAHGRALTPQQIRILGTCFPNARALLLIDVGFNTATTQELIRHFPLLRMLDLTRNPEFTLESENILRTASWFNNLVLLRLDSSTLW